MIERTEALLADYARSPAKPGPSRARPAPVAAAPLDFWYQGRPGRLCHLQPRRLVAADETLLERVATVNAAGRVRRPARPHPRGAPTAHRAEIKAVLPLPPPRAAPALARQRPGPPASRSRCWRAIPWPRHRWRGYAWPGTPADVRSSALPCARPSRSCSLWIPTPHAHPAAQARRTAQ
ncbi:hypothetical protein DSL92_05420 [Billgrantia gudaonensis]|uniref:Uncharacterized protein n=1 Tax=Billgrantia gudaonensis TaxID=376427 RepID=A0A432JJ15_9GAMM|nr:hypothetical protein DSL92_05420 [Halomonas gudaonensis]